ncbi:MAG: HIT domain-containing protein [Alphaproteobacteria bacterium]|nr:HIT domain-containing protein [Alphaproteobacteria bacterium]MDD9919230.1 HIT domain-containing protein [Alphaproteobacteria bacterium]
MLDKSKITIFEKFATGEEEPDKVIYEDNKIIAFKNINPRASVHIILIPKQKITSLAEATEEHTQLLGYMMVKASEIAHEQGVGKTGFRVHMNTGTDANQTIPYLHLHITGGENLGSAVGGPLEC